MCKKMRRILLSVLLALPLLLAVQVSSAQPVSLIGNDVPCRGKFISGQITADCIPLYIAYVIQQVFKFTGAICLIAIMIGGFQYALGNLVGGKDKALATIRWAVLGMIISALSFFIIDFILSALGA